MKSIVNTPTLARRCAPVRSVAVRASKPQPPTVTETKAKFLAAYQLPIPAIYGNIINELMVQQHVWRYNTNYKYDEVFALGFVSVYDQLTDGYDATEREKIFKAYIEALGEDPARYRKDAAALEAAASKLSGPEGLLTGDFTAPMQQITARVQSGKFYYTRFFAIGLFRLLELTGAKDPEALKSLVAAIGVSQDLVTKDLTLYKSILNRLQGAKDLMKDFLERERRKAAERAAEKETKAANASA